MQPVERSNPEGVDFGWVMQVTFVTTILVGAPIVAALSTTVTLPTWESRVSFAVRVGAIIWILVALGAYTYARRTDAGDGGSEKDESEDDESVETVGAVEATEAAEMGEKTESAETSETAESTESVEQSTDQATE